MIIPGLINAHLHSWQTGLRAVGADWTLLQYLTHIRVGVARHYTNVHIGNLAGAPNQINCGTTTLGDWWHCGPTPERTDAAVMGLACNSFTHPIGCGTSTTTLPRAALTSVGDANRIKHKGHEPFRVRDLMPHSLGNR